MYIDPYWQNHSPLESYWHVFVFAYYVFLFIFGVVSNLSVIFHYTKCTTIVKPHDYLLINLMVADLLIILANLPIAIFNCLYGEWQFGQIGCNIYGFCGALSGFVSISTMVLISIERLLVIRKPFKVLHSNKSSTVCCLIVAWTYGLLWAFLPFASRNQYVVEGFQTSCSLDFISRDYFDRIILILMNIFGFCLPIIIITCSYTFILIYVKTRYNHIKMRIFESSSIKAQESISLQTTNNSNTTIQFPSTLLQQTNLLDNQQKFSSTRRYSFKLDSIARSKVRRTTKQSSSIAIELQVTKNTLLIISVFCLAWLPYCLVTLISQFVEHRELYVTPHTTLIPVLLAKLSTVLNPIIYVFKSHHFRRNMTKYIVTSCRRSS